MELSGKVVAGVFIGAVVLLLFVRMCSSGSTSRADSIAAVSVAEVWKEYLAPSKRFVVSLPTPPQHAVQTIPTEVPSEKIRHDMMLSQAKRGTIFMVNMIDYPQSVDVANSKEVLLAAIKEIVAGNPLNQLVRTDFGSSFGFPSMDFVIKNHDIIIRGKAVLKEHSLYVITVADDNPQTVDDSYTKLIRSFKILD